MTIFPFFKQPTPRRFDHKPIYYDKQAEERRERYDRIRKQLEMEEAEKKLQQNGQQPTEGASAPLTASQRHDQFEKDIRGSFRENIPGGSRMDKLAKTNRTVMIVFAVLVVLAMLLIWKLS